MSYWLISAFLSGWAAGASIFINLLLALQLSVAEYGAWVRLTALLPLASALIAPLALTCNRVSPEFNKQAKQAARSLMVLALGAAVVAQGAVLTKICLPRIDYIAGIALWIASFSKVALDGLLLSPRIVEIGISDKIARSIVPTSALLILLLFRPTTVSMVCICLAGATGLACLASAHWLGKHLDETRVKMVDMSRLYFKELPSAYLSLVSLGVFSIPLFLFSKAAEHSAAAALGIALTVVQGAVAFATLILSRHSLALTQAIMLKERHETLKIHPFIVVSILCSALSALLISGYGIYRALPNWGSLAAATSALVLIEITQGTVTAILLRIGDRRVIASATVSAMLNTALASILAGPIELIWALTGVQLVSFLFPGVWRLKVLLVYYKFDFKKLF